MEKHNKKRASLRQYPVLLAFGLFFLGLFVLDLVTPDRAYSELENTTLAQRPKLTAPTEDGLNNYRSEERRVGKECRSRWSAAPRSLKSSGTCCAAAP